MTPLFASTFGERIGEMIDLFERNPYATFLVLTIFALVWCARLLIKEKNAHLATSQSLIPVAESLAAIIERNDQVVGEIVDQLKETKAVLDRSLTVVESLRAGPRSARRAPSVQDLPAVKPGPSSGGDTGGTHGGSQG